MQLCPIELRMNSECQKYIKVYQTALKSVLNWFLFGNNILRWIIKILSRKPIVSLILWSNHWIFFFGGQFWIFVGFLNLFIIKDLVFGFGHWPLSEILFNFDFKRLYSKTYHLSKISAQFCVKRNFYGRNCILFMNGKINNKIFSWTKFICVSSLVFLGHPLVQLSWRVTPPFWFWADMGVRGGLDLPIFGWHNMWTALTQTWATCCQGGGSCSWLVKGPPN